MKPGMESNTSSPAVVGVDIGKDVFHLVGFAAGGKIAFRGRIRRLASKTPSRSCRRASSAWKRA
jgi:hypothetical protein